MRTSAAIAALSAAVLTAPAFAFRDTSPLLLWASDPSHAFEEATRLISGSALTAADEVYTKISNLGCEWESVVVVHVDDLHHSHLPSLGFPSHDAHLHIPYLSRPDWQSLQSRVDDWAKTCGAEVVNGFDSRPQGSKAVIKLDMKKDDTVPSLPADLPSPHIMIVTGSRASTQKEKRQDDEYPFPTFSSGTATTTATVTPTATSTGRHRNSTIPTDGPLLERVQILTAPIITALLVSFGLFIPIAAFGVYSLTGIQVPPRMMEIGKALVVEKGRKDQ